MPTAAQPWTPLILGSISALLLLAAAWWSQRCHRKQRQAQRQLYDTAEHLRIVIDGLQSYAIFVLDTHGNVASWNSGAERLKGYTAAEILGQHFSRFYAQEDIDQGKPELQLRLAAQNGRFEAEQWRVRKDGTPFLATLVIAATRGPGGELSGYYEMSRDITERQDNEARYRGLLEAAPDAMVVVNQAGEIVLLNLQAEKQFGYHRDELLGQPITNLIPQGFAERLIADGTRSAADALAQQIGTGIELIGRRKDGSSFPIEMMLSPLEGADGILVTAAVRDITNRKRDEAHLIRTVGELKRSNAELEHFAYVASHDLQEPLRMVASFTELLAKRYKGRLDADADDFIGFVVDGVNRMHHLIRDLLAYSQAGGGGQELRNVSSQGALDASLSNLRVAIEESGASVTHDPLPTLRTNHTQLAQIFQNLIGNAIKYRSAEDPRVHISAVQSNASGWTFSVQDNGIGIEPLYFDRIFVLFQRLHKSDAFDGTGIGLAICKKTVERLGGRIWVDSQLGSGATFHFSLPEGFVA